MVKIGRHATTRWGVLVAGAVAAALVAAGSARVTTAAAEIATSVPQVVGPIPSTAAPGDPSHDYVFYATPMNLAKVGYEEQEYFIRGVATRMRRSTRRSSPRSIRPTAPMSRR
jgi:hypothetical protein